MKKLFLVGGAVRDKLMGKTPTDYDFVAVGFSYNEMIKEHGDPVGNDFPVFLNHIPGYGVCEIAMARREKSTGDKHTDFTVEFGKDVTLEEDLYRRDFTINAIAYDIEKDKYIDPYNGIQDIQNKILRATNPEAFIEDPLRVFRLARFVAKTNFTIEKNTFELAKSMKHKLQYLTSERVWKETEKALKTDYPYLYFQTLKDLDVLEVWFSEIAKLINVEQYNHKEDAFEHTMMTVKILKEFTNDTKMLFAMLTHDLGKGTTPKEILPKHTNHELRSAVEIRKMRKRLPIPNDYIKIALWFAENHKLFHKIDKLSYEEIMELMYSIKRNRIDIKDIIIFRYADNRGRIIDDYEYFKNKEEQLEKILVNAEIAYNSVDGKMLLREGIEPGEKFGKILFERRVKNLKELLKEV